jgi:hypothetical protein
LITYSVAVVIVNVASALTVSYLIANAVAFVVVDAVLGIQVVRTVLPVILTVPIVVLTVVKVIRTVFIIEWVVLPTGLSAYLRGNKQHKRKY